MGLRRRGAAIDLRAGHGRRLAIAMGRRVPNAGGALLHELGVNGGSLLLPDLPRPGFPAIDCEIQSPTALGGESVGALDWK